MSRSFPQVASAVHRLIEEEISSPEFSALLLRLMARPGRVLAAEAPTKWPAFTLETCGALGGDVADATWAATAVELAVAAADVIDDVVDDEWNEQGITSARAVNASAALIWLAQRCMPRMAASTGIGQAQRIGDIVARGYLAASAGEDLDLLLESAPGGDEECAYAMTREKSGSLVSMACQAGAAVAGADAIIVEAVGGFGGHMGVIAQLLNDLTGMDPAASARSSDLRQKKKTLPIAYALRCAAAEGNALILDWYQPGHMPSAGEEQALAAELRTIGAFHYGWVIADIHRREALLALRALARLTGDPAVYRLRRLIPALPGRPRHERTQEEPS